MKRKTLILPLALIICLTLACSFDLSDLPELTELPFEGELEVGSMEEYEEQIPSEGVEEADVIVRFGAGKIAIAPGTPDTLLHGEFRTNVVEWAPEVTWRNGTLRIEQENIERIGIPTTSSAENEWDLEFSPDVPLDMRVQIGASQGNLDFSGLSLTNLRIETGASDLDVQFDAPNPVEMDELRIQAGAADLTVDGIGNASPQRAHIQGGAGSLDLGFDGQWSGSAGVEIESGMGALTLRLPRDIGVRVAIKDAIGEVSADAGLTRSGDAYVNQAYGETENELTIEVTIGLGSLDLELIGE